MPARPGRSATARRDAPAPRQCDARAHPFAMKQLTTFVFWTVQISALLVFAVPFSAGLIVLWAVSHFLRAIGLTLAFHRYFAHRAFKMNRITRFVWAFIGTAAMQKGP